ncbi:MAG: hypothetical protein LKE53_04150 [Oscillospiraceae bacterium]|jgi:endonuclease III|nr:hypothetical protein [Oscillospiraceae bacterium]MDD3261353.1 hypothetical protein [Oscillospiraceae bacterium]
MQPEKGKNEAQETAVKEVMSQLPAYLQETIYQTGLSANSAENIQQFAESFAQEETDRP